MCYNLHCVMKTNNKSNLYKYILLFFAAFLWGSTFVAQDVGMDHIGPFTFSGVRNLIGALFLVPISLIYTKIVNKRSKEHLDSDGSIIPKNIYIKNTVIGGIVCGLVLCVASNLQQSSMLYVGPGKAGFITSMYVVLVPVVGIFLKRKIPFTIWIAVVTAVCGLYLLCIKDTDFSIGIGEILLLLCAMFFTLHILVIDYFVVKANPVFMSCIQFFVCGTLSSILMFIFEVPTIEHIMNAMGPILYAAILSSGIAYTFQIIGQNGTNPTIASIIMCLESVVSVLSGWLYLNELLTTREIIGCIVMFAAILISQIPVKKSKSNLYSG